MDRNKLVKYWISQRIIKEKKLIQAFKEVPRENFILDIHKNEAYGDYPLSIGYDQTISQPTTVIIMINALEIVSTDTVLEIGAGSGYNAALLAKLAKKVYSIENIPGLERFAKANIKRLNIKNIKIIGGDGSLGIPTKKFNKIVLTAAIPNIPEILITQLKRGGIIVAPVGDLNTQKMIKGKKQYTGMEYEEIGEFRFVPLRGKYGF